MAGLTELKALGDSATSFEGYLDELRAGNPKAPSGVSYFWGARQFAEDLDATYLSSAGRSVATVVLEWAERGDEKAKQLVAQWPHWDIFLRRPSDPRCRLWNDVRAARCWSVPLPRKFGPPIPCSSGEPGGCDALDNVGKTVCLPYDANPAAESNRCTSW